MKQKIGLGGIIILIFSVLIGSYFIWGWIGIPIVFAIFLIGFTTCFIIRWVFDIDCPVTIKRKDNTGE